MCDSDSIIFNHDFISTAHGPKEAVFNLSVCCFLSDRPNSLAIDKKQSQ